MPTPLPRFYLKHQPTSWVDVQRTCERLQATHGLEVALGYLISVDPAHLAMLRAQHLREGRIQ